MNVNSFTLVTSLIKKKGDWITIDGGSGEVMEGQVNTLPPATESGVVQEFLAWADECAVLKVRTNADNGTDATKARELGAVGIGLCRTEHMFFQPEALRAMRQMLLAPSETGRRRALQQILPMQREEFKELFRAMNGLPSPFVYWTLHCTSSFPNAKKTWSLLQKTWVSAIQHCKIVSRRLP